MQLFYRENFAEVKQLDDTDSKHCIKVLRKNVGDEIWVTDGKGGMYHCRIEDANPKRTGLYILSEEQGFQKAKRRIHLAIAPTKNLDRITYLVEKATEIGISEISFILTSNSERKVVKTDRIERVAISAMKQSLKAYLPKVNEMISINQFLEENTASQRFVCHLSDLSKPLTEHKIESDVCLLVGPEGDFDPSELEMAAKAGFEQVSLGDSRLRTETAGLVGVTLLNLL
ncbi:16S rRNA (uracil(1498)-N(3))-methyltransferase [Jiulongibacter sediminis]|uniref:Ribosomal RNA small subunit methyltransferase E n=1 Tax=Jiulongibacter sediminis TaxID=1605367 RepID=A0A0P7BXL0_9BACT|nr:16S rRNA (uracil(1498)-N(3))-methyltransferase [Jiulongibacter sediminis]KPM49626.1 16S rRNA methyltransferase [Jiulongibacter sediminis]TBX26664.1 16S rRNA methyltransferase [Jiulongibacter sediminis]